MNLFIGIGQIVDVNLNGRVLKFNLAVHQERPCLVPCVLFDPDDEVQKFMEHLQSIRQVVWLQGKISFYEFKNKEKVIRIIDIITYAKSIKPI